MRTTLCHRSRLLGAAAMVIACGVDSARRNPARRCARSTSACRSRRRTWCTPRPMSRRRWASSPSAASTPTSCSSRAASRRPRRSPRRRAPRSSASATSSIGRGLKVQQIWGLAPRMPQAYMVQDGITTAADLKGKRLSATGGGVGGFNWRMGREVLKSAGLDVGDAQFIPSPTAGRLPGLIANQIDGVALHPGGRVPRQAAEADAERAGAARRADAELHVQRLRRLDRMDRARPRAAARHRRRDDRGQPRDLPRQGQGHPDHRRGDQEAEGGGRVRLGDRDQELRLVGQHRLRSPSARNGRSTTASPTATSRRRRSRRWSRWRTSSSPRRRWSSPAGGSRSASARSEVA